MNKPTISKGTVHALPDDFRKALLSDKTVRELWEDITPLARNEFICWVEEAKQEATRQRRIRRSCEELLEGKRRPCCWAGCIHRPEKPPTGFNKSRLEKLSKKGA